MSSMLSLLVLPHSPGVACDINPQSEKGVLARIKIFGTYTIMMDEDGEIRDEFLPDEFEGFESAEEEKY